MPVVKTIEKKSMTMPEIRTKAKALGITPGKMNKVDLIHTIQITERNRPCFGTSNGHCVYIDCCFMNDCLKIRV
jgi:hypothetical protein